MKLCKEDLEIMKREYKRWKRQGVFASGSENCPLDHQKPYVHICLEIFPSLEVDGPNGKYLFYCPCEALEEGLLSRSYFMSRICEVIRTGEV